MGFFKVGFKASKSDTLKMLSDNERVNRNVCFNAAFGTPHMTVKAKNDRVRITCEMLGRNRKDNGFIVGTFFIGKLKEKDGVTKLSGFILTAPIYHLIILALMVVLIVQCFKYGALSVVPIFIVMFDILLFKDEFKKRGYIKRYIFRASRRIYQDKSDL